ncbi:TPA: hypothetical protein EYP44_00580 [Candidatus Bathyarchaeota archaeon]|nr:hypothetical protein [Candidatus Bathyarchaeota archaeon]
MLVGHGTVRASTMGYDDRPPTREEIERMKEHVAIAMENGAFGLSSGLIYPPGCYAETDELIELCKVVSRYGGIYASHVRNEGRNLIQSVREAIEIGGRSDVPVEISRFKASGKPNWGKVRGALKMVEEVGPWALT